MPPKTESTGQDQGQAQDQGQGQDQGAPLPAQFLAATRLRASAVALIAGQGADGRAFGLAAALVMPVSNDPPELLVAVNRQAQSGPLLQAVGRFSVNLLAAHHQPLCALFADPGQRARRFADPAWAFSPVGPPILVDALASFDCQLVGTAQSGTHLLLTGRVLHLHLGAAGQAPLVHFAGSYHRLADPVA